jgi:hypothetical protein
MRKSYAELPEKEKKKCRARAYARVYVKRGKIQKEPCEVPGCKEEAQMHHPDYNQPLKVEWMCRGHHMMWHRIESGKFLEPVIK